MKERLSHEVLEILEDMLLFSLSNVLPRKQPSLERDTSNLFRSHNSPTRAYSDLLREFKCLVKESHVRREQRVRTHKKKNSN